MTTVEIPTTIKPGALELAREYGVEKELYAIVEEGQRVVVGLRGFEIEAEPSDDMGDPCVVVRAIIDPASDDDPSHQAWWSWRIDRFGIDTAGRFLVVTRLDRSNDER